MNYIRVIQSKCIVSAVETVVQLGGVVTLTPFLPFKYES